ncbi:MAG: hypothetical protein BRC31_06000, partial [Actinobacteria bacterium QS_5_72_10]
MSAKLWISCLVVVLLAAVAGMTGLSLVRARNDRAATVSTAGYAFRILPPWYRTWAAYATYLAALVLLAFAAPSLLLAGLLLFDISVSGELMLAALGL